MFAQTNLQLYCQLRRENYGNEVLESTRDAYEFSVPVFSGQYRASGKPFVAHLVGTASVLAAQAESADMLLAGLLHAVYSNADLGFHPGRRRSARQRQFLRERIGVGAEELIAHYDACEWSAASISAWRENHHRLTVAERGSLKISLANTVDDFMDGGMCMPLSAKSRLYADANVQANIVALAELERWTTLAGLLERLFTEFNDAQSRLQATGGAGTATLRLPPSATRRLSPRIRGYINRRLRRFMSAGGSRR
tara:strand:- start:11636 stop:12394 length:759 start_codon:yes stop_codon:yes gene_type:complete